MWCNMQLDHIVSCTEFFKFKPIIKRVRRRDTKNLNMGEYFRLLYTQYKSPSISHPVEETNNGRDVYRN